MAVPKVETRIIENKLFSKTLSGEISWRLIYDESGEVTHLFESLGITNTPGAMKCFVYNEAAGVEIEKEKLKCYKAKILDGKIIGDFSSEKINTPLITQGNEKVFYAADISPDAYDISNNSFSKTHRYLNTFVQILNGDNRERMNGVSN